MRSKGASKMRQVLLLLMVVALALPGAVIAEEQSAIEEFFCELNLTERDDGSFYTLVDQEGNVIMRTARIVHEGDTWIGIDNRKFEVYQVEGDTAYAAAVQDREERGSLISRIQSFLTGLWPSAQPVQQDGEVNRRVAVYNTHGAEAYVPNDGVESDPDGGGIITVAESLAQALEDQGVEVAQSTETHVPHDAGAYKRSRDTVQELLQEGVDATIDVHRDAIPAEEYLGEVEGQGEMVQIQLVVGRQNQNQGVIQQFAEDLKALADEKYPGLVKGIFSAQGNYNQDMTPNSILIEVGTHENDREAAQESVVLFADVLSTYLYGEGAAAQAADGGGRNAFTTILWLLAIVIVGGGIFLYVSAGSWPEMKRKLQGFAKGEFGDLFKTRVDNRGNDDDPDDLN